MRSPTATLWRETRAVAAALAAALAVIGSRAYGLAEGELLPTGVRITPTAAPGAIFEALNPDLPTRPDFVADHAASTAMSPDGKTLLVLTTGYNRNNAYPSGATIPAESNEYVFVFDATQSPPLKRQVLQVPNTFFGIERRTGPTIRFSATSPVAMPTPR